MFGFGKKQEEQGEEAQQQTEMFPDLGEPEPEEEFLPGFKTREEAEKYLTEVREREQQPTGPTINDLMERLIATQQQQQRQVEPPPPTLDYGKLPDPVEDREGYTRALDQHYQSVLKYELGKHSRQTSEQDQLNSLEREFNARYPDLADFTDVVRLAADDVGASLRSGGVDPRQYIASERERFMQRVAENANQRISQLRQKFGVSQPAPNRTTGVSAGSGSQGGAGGGKGGQKFTSLVDELKAVQRDSGFF